MAAGEATAASEGAPAVDELRRMSEPREARRMKDREPASPGFWKMGAIFVGGVVVVAVVLVLVVLTHSFEVLMEATVSQRLLATEILRAGWLA